MSGGAGDDTYVVDAAAEVVTEAAGEGLDKVLSSANHTLSADVEELTGALIALVRDEELRERYGRRSLEIIADYSMESCARAIVASGRRHSCSRSVRKLATSRSEFWSYA